MTSVVAGNPVTVTAEFGLDGQPLPDAVSFVVEQPDGTRVSFPAGSPRVSNASGGLWLLSYGLPAEVGVHRWSAEGYAATALTETVVGDFDVLPNPEDPEAPVPPGPLLGPCGSWITGDDVAACARVDYSSNPAVFDRCAYEASMALYEISGRKFTGLCQRLVRPVRNGCSCWPISYGMGPWYWMSTPWGYGGASWLWRNEQGDAFGCQPMSRINLAGYPVRKILRVLIDGVVLPELDPDTGAPNWRLDEWRYLTRCDEPGNPEQPRFWPGCQNMSLDDDQPGTFSIDYQWGVDPPSLGRGAAVELANQIFLACGGHECVLPAGAVRVERQGITVERGLLANWADPNKAVGLVQVDLFLQAYWKGGRSGRVGAVWSPDRAGFARPVGTRSQFPS